VTKVRNSSATDADAAIEAALTARLRAMTPTERLAHVAALNDAVLEMARAGARMRYPSASDDETRMRVLALRLGRDLMVRAYGWDPHEQGW
jgi:acyl-CoA reductase-like NAD-dependent aldehyde dehydrogenase